jgi:DNA replicative helicase MCM subunit Mcm2 (Cdc46/Mcm family)
MLSDTTAIREKLKEIYDDFAANITQIYGRQDLHLAIDLVYHSPLKFVFDGRTIEKAYPEVLVIGDTRTGKTQAAEALLKHYGCGASAQAEAMSYSGLVGGCQKMFDTQWDVTWGKLPQNNRRLLIIDEASGMDEKLLGNLSSIRSSGIATIEKIAAAKTESKTRILWLSNPKQKITVGQFSSGISVIESLCSQPEDIARWDMAIIVAKDDVDVYAHRSNNGKVVPHRFTAQRCHDLVLWAWTREKSEVFLSKETCDACYVLGKKMSEKYDSGFTLVHEAEQPLKLARLATALAARLFSSPDGNKLVVEPCHVEYIYEYLNRVYDSRHFGYDTYCLNSKSGNSIIDLEDIQEFMVRIKEVGCNQFLMLEKMRLKDIEEFLGVTTDEAKTMLARLLQNNALKRLGGDYYRKSQQFNEMLRAFVTEGRERRRLQRMKEKEEDGL